MKKRLGVVVLVCVLLLTTSFAYAAETESDEYPTYEQTVSAYLDQDGTTVEVTLDVGGGWSAEFVRGAVYLYNGKIEDGKDADAIGLTLDKNVFEEYVKNAPTYDTYKEYAHCFSYEDMGWVNYFYNIDGEAYFMISVNSETVKDPDAVSARYSISLE